MRLVRAGVLFGFLLLAAGCAQETIAHQQEERQANRIRVILEKQGIQVDKVKDEDSRELRFNVLVAQEDAAEALAVLEEHNLPETPRPDTAAMFQEGGMIPTTEQERAKRVVGVEGDIVNALRSLPRVVSVEAAVSIPEVDPLRDVNEERPQPKIAVIVVFQPDENGNPPMPAESVQRFVQAKLPELKTNGVSVDLIPSETAVSMNGNGNGPGITGSPTAPPIDPAKGCMEKEGVIGIEVCKGNKKKVINLLLVAIIVAGLLAGLAVVAVLRAMRYRKDLTRLTAQFQRHGK